MITRTKSETTKGIIAQGNPNCKHQEENFRNDNRHEMGVCVKCGRTKDYTILRNEDDKDLFRKSVNMSLLMRANHPKIKVKLKLRRREG